MTVNLEQLQMTQMETIRPGAHIPQEEVVKAYDSAMSTLMAEEVEVIDSWEAANNLPEDHSLWRLELLNTAYERTEWDISEDVQHIAQVEVFRGAVTLASCKLPRNELNGLGLPADLLTNAKDVSSVTLKDVRLLARAWDNSGRDEILLEICDRAISQLDDQQPGGDSSLRKEEFAILYRAAKTGISYKESLLQHLSIGNEIDVYSKIGQRLVRIYSET